MNVLQDDETLEEVPGRGSLDRFWLRDEAPEDSGPIASEINEELRASLAAFEAIQVTMGRASMPEPSAGHRPNSADSMTLMDFHFPDRNRSEKHAAIARM